MVNNLAVITVFLPLISGVINGLFALKLTKKQASYIAVAAIVTSSLCAMAIFYHATLSDAFKAHIRLGTFLVFSDNARTNWAIYIDQLTAIMFVVVTCVSAVVHIYSLGYMHDDHGLPKFLSFLSLFTFFMLALVSADNFLQLFFGWEGVGLCSYLLIGFWYHKDSACKAAIKAFIVNRVGDFAFILGVAVIIIYAGKADFAAVFPMAKDLASMPISFLGIETSVLTLACLLLFFGAMGKSAQLGLHVWLPDAMEGPTPVSALIHAATMVTAGVFLVARCSYLFEYAPSVLVFMTIIGGLTAVIMAVMAVAQSDIKKIIAYSTCSQLGYMFIACGVSAYHVGIFHLVTHAFFKALLFLSAGSVIHACHEQNIFKMGGLKDKMPITYVNFWIGSLAIIGIFPLAGFYSKDLILESVYEVQGVAANLGFAFGIVAAILTAIYSMKIIYVVFHGETKLSKDVWGAAHEAPSIMNLPMLVLVAGSLLSGMIGYYILSIAMKSGYFGTSIFTLKEETGPDMHEISLWVKNLPLIVGVAGIIAGLGIYKFKIQIAVTEFLAKMLDNKCYLDLIYDNTVIRFINKFSAIFGWVDQKIIDRFGPGGLASAAIYFARYVSNLQTGYVFNYSFVIVLYIIACITVFALNAIGII